MQVWLHAFAFPHRSADRARQAEAWGFDGMLVADSQNLNADERFATEVGGSL